MYIPTSFFSSQGSCITATTSTITGSGTITTGSFVSGGFVWDYYQFEMTDKTNASLTSFTASLNILSGSTGRAKLLIVGGGGTGADANATSIGVGTFPNINSYLVYAGGGGGGGGVVYYNNFPISSGSYEIGVGAATSGNRICPPYYSGLVCGKVGNPSYFKNKNIAYTPFTSSTIIAYGGGGGGAQGQYSQVSPSDTLFVNAPASNPDGFIWASGGGQSGTPGSLGTPLRISPANSNFITAGGIDLGGLNGRDQGNDGGYWCGGSDAGAGYTQAGGAGGGGAATSGSNLGNGCADAGTYVTNGGDGLTFNLTDTSIIVGNGGGGANDNTNTQGVRGSGAADTYGSGGNAYKGTSTPQTGNGGLVIVTIPRCLYPSVSGSTYTVYQMQSCCDTASFSNVAVQSGVSFGLNYVIYNPNENKCMKSVAVVDTYDNVSFTLTTANNSSYNYGTDAYSGSVQCLNCRNANGLSGCLPITNTCQTWTFRYTANLPNPPSGVSYVNCDTGLTSSFTLSPLNRNGSACVRSGTTPTVGANIIITSGPGAYCGVY